MCDLPSCKTPDSLNRIQIWRVRRQPKHPQTFSVLGKKGPQFFLLMITSIVDDHRQLLSAAIFAAEEIFEESLERDPIEFSFFGRCAKTSGLDIDGAPIANLRSGGCRRNFWLCSARPPHSDHARPLLKMDLVLGIEANLRVPNQADQFFLKVACASGSAPFGDVRGRNRRMPK